MQKMTRFGFYLRSYDPSTSGFELFVVEYPNEKQIPHQILGSSPYWHRGGIVYDLDNKRVVRVARFYMRRWINNIEDVSEEVKEKHLEEFSKMELSSRKEVKYFAKHGKKIIPKWRRDWRRRLKKLDV